MIDTFLRIITHLLPNARAWRITVDKTLRKFFEGLAPLGVDVKTFYDLILLDILPSATRELEAWERQFGLNSIGLTEQQRRDRLDAAWKEIGGQDPNYIQAILQDNGFDVYVHEWWVPGTEPAINSHAAATPRDPTLYLRDSATGIVYRIECGEPLAECGEPLAEAGETAGPTGYALVNKVYIATAIEALAGEPLMACGEPAAECGNILGYSEILKTYTIPADPTKWPYFLYIGGAVFGDLATIDPKRKNEFEELCLKICPTQQWLGILVNYN